MIFIDTETTGVAQDADIIELGAISVEPANHASIRFNVFSELIYPRKDVYISLCAFKKHGITERELSKYGSPPKETLELFIEWIKLKSPDYLVAHNPTLTLATPKNRHNTTYCSGYADLH